MDISPAIFVRDPSAELSACEPDPNGFAPHQDDPEEGVHVDLWLRDRDVVAAINAHPEGRRRIDYIRTAIRIGVLALQQAQGRIDTESVRNEGDRLIAALENRLAQYQDQLHSVLGGTLNHPLIFRGILSNKRITKTENLSEKNRNAPIDGEDRHERPERVEYWLTV
jgi:hypothetical protein